MHFYISVKTSSAESDTFFTDKIFLWAPGFYFIFFLFFIAGRKRVVDDRRHGGPDGGNVIVYMVVATTYASLYRDCRGKAIEQNIETPH